MKLVLFDFDGVLVDTLFVCHDISKEVNENLSLEEFKTFFTGNINDSKRIDGTSSQFHPQFATKYDKHTREMEIDEVFKGMVKELAIDFGLVIISSAHSSSIEKILEREGLGEYFKDILGWDVHTSKVEKIKMILSKYNTAPKDAVFVTDTLGDILEAKECDVVSVAVTWGFHDRKTLAKGAPIVILDDPNALLSAIQNVLK